MASYKGSRDVLAGFYTSFIKDDTSRRLHLTDKFDDWVGHLNTTFAQRGREFERSNLQKFKCPEGMGAAMLKFRVDRRIICIA